MSSTTPPPPDPADRAIPGDGDTEPEVTGPEVTGAEVAEPGVEEPEGGYPSYPQASGAPDDAIPTYPQGTEPLPEEVPQPQSIYNAVRLMWAGAALSVIGLIIGLLSLSTIKDTIRTQLQNNHDYSADKLNTAYAVAVISTILVAVVATALWLLMARANGAGKKWARITATVLGGTNILGFILTIAQGQDVALQLVLSAINVILAIAILWLLWRPESTEYYLAKSTRY